jgi:hypothetical protein
MIAGNHITGTAESGSRGASTRLWNPLESVAARSTRVQPSAHPVGQCIAAENPKDKVIAR